MAFPPVPPPCTARPSLAHHVLCTQPSTHRTRHAPTPTPTDAPQPSHNRVHALQFARDDMEREAIHGLLSRNPAVHGPPMHARHAPAPSLATHVHGRMACTCMACTACTHASTHRCNHNRMHAVCARRHGARGPAVHGPPMHARHAPTPSLATHVHGRMACTACTAAWHARHASTPAPTHATTTECMQFARDDMEREAITRREARNPPLTHLAMHRPCRTHDGAR
jgi:hypothetical protein